MGTAWTGGLVGIWAPILTALLIVFPTPARGDASPPTGSDAWIMILLDGPTHLQDSLEVVIHCARPLVRHPRHRLGIRTVGGAAATEAPGAGATSLLLPLAQVTTTGLEGVDRTAAQGGLGSLAEALRETGSDLAAPDPARRAIILVSAGEGRVPRDACEAVGDLRTRSPPVAVHVVAYRREDQSDPRLACIARQSGGRFTRARDWRELDDELRLILELTTRGGSMLLASRDRVEDARIIPERRGRPPLRHPTRIEIQLLPGTYRAELPAPSSMTIPGISVEAGGVTRVPVEGHGSLSVLDPDPLAVVLVRLEETLEEVVRGEANHWLRLPAGRYRLEILGDPAAGYRTADLQEGATLRVSMASTGILYVDTPGLVEGIRVLDSSTGGPVLEAHSRIAVDLPPGRYRVIVPLETPFETEVEIRCGKTTVVRPLDPEM